MLFLNNYIFRNKIFYLFVAFAFSRVFYYEFFNIKFDTWTLDVYWQFIPQELLKNNLIESIIYNHFQPPFLNLFLGLVMKITDQYFLILQLSYLFFGYCSFLLIYLICKNFDFTEKISFLVSLTLMILPTTILYENHFYKEYLTFFFLLWVFYSSLNIYKNPFSIKYLLYLSFSLSLLCLTRETFHIFWAYILIFIIQKRLTFKKSILLFFIFSILTAPFYLKNLILFDKFAINTSSIYEHLSQKIDYVKEMNDSSRHEKIRNFTFGSYDNYLDFKKKTSPLYDVPINNSAYSYKEFLDYNYKRDVKLLKTNTLFNEVFFEVDKHRKKDFYLVVKEHPFLFLLNILNSVTRHLFHSSDYFNFTKPNADKMKIMIKLSDCIKLTPVCIYDYGFVWQKTQIGGNEYLGMDTGPLDYKEKIIFSLQYTNFLLVILYTFLLFEFFRLIIFKKDRSNNVLIIFWLMTFLFIFSALVVFEDGEISRHRFPFDYLCFIIFLKRIKSRFKIFNRPVL
jgi:hypothetical protein